MKLPRATSRQNPRKMINKPRRAGRSRGGGFMVWTFVISSYSFYFVDGLSFYFVLFYGTLWLWLLVDAGVLFC
jgi:hypothetical protein